MTTTLQLKTEEGEVNFSRKKWNVSISGKFVCIDTGELHGERDEIMKINWDQVMVQFKSIRTEFRLVLKAVMSFQDFGAEGYY